MTFSAIAVSKFSAPKSEHLPRRMSPESRDNTSSPEIDTESRKKIQVTRFKHSLDKEIASTSENKSPDRQPEGMVNV